MFMQSKSKDLIPQPDLIRLPGQGGQSAEAPVVSPSRRRYLEKIRAANTTQNGDT